MIAKLKHIRKLRTVNSGSAETVTVRFDSAQGNRGLATRCPRRMPNGSSQSNVPRYRRRCSPICTRTAANMLLTRNRHKGRLNGSIQSQGQGRHCHRRGGRHRPGHRTYALVRGLRGRYAPALGELAGAQSKTHPGSCRSSSGGTPYKMAFARRRNTSAMPAGAGVNRRAPAGYCSPRNGND